MYKFYFISGSLRDRCTYRYGRLISDYDGTAYPVLDVLPGGKCVIRKGNRTVHAWPYPKRPYHQEYRRRYRKRATRPLNKPRGEYWRLNKEGS